MERATESHSCCMMRVEENMEKTLLTLRWCNSLWRLLCACGFICCVVIRSQLYFRFPTTTKTGPTTPPRVLPPHLTLCFSLQSLVSGPVEHYFTDDGSEDTFLNKTVDQLLAYTPRDNETLTGCVYRDFDYNTFTRVWPGEQCVPRFFTVTRFRMQGYCCYKYHISNNASIISLYDLAYGWSYPQIIYGLSITYPLNSGHKVCPIVHLDDEAYDVRLFNQEFVISLHAKQAYELTFNVLHLHRLRYPYDTNCIEISKSQCKLKCLQAAYAKFSLTPLSGSTQLDQTNLTLPNFIDKYDGRKLSDIILETQSSCQQKCTRTQCDRILTETHTTNPFPAINGEKLTFYLRNTYTPPFLMKSIPVMSTVDYLTEILSLAGIWINFSFLAVIYFIVDFIRSKSSTEQPSYLTRRAKIIRLGMRMLRYSSTVNRKVSSFSSSGERRAKKLASLVINLILRIIVATCFFLQVIQLAESYLAYRVLTKLRFDYNPIVREIPKLVVCADFDEFLGDINWPVINMTNYDDVFSAEASRLNFTIDQMISISPPPEDIIIACRIRPSVDEFPSLIFKRAPECLNLFAMDKFYWKGICYSFEVTSDKFSPKTTDLHFFEQRSLKGLIAHPGILYSIVINSNFSNFGHLDLNLYVDHLKFDSQNHAVRMNPLKDRNLLTILSNHLLDTKLLPPPYETMCDDNLGSYCRYMCVIDAGKRVGRLPHDQIYHSNISTNIKPISYIDLRDSHFLRTWVAADKSCDVKCSRSDCHLSTNIIYTKSIFHSSEKLEFAIDSFASVSWYITIVPVINLYDFFFNLLCMFSFFYGISFITINPIAIYMKYFCPRSLSYLTRKIETVKQQVDTVSQSLRQIDRKLRFQLRADREDQPFYENLMNRVDVRRIICICVVGIFFLVHTYFAISSYLAYPTTMNLKLQSDKSIRYELAICLNLHEIFSPNKSSGRVKSDLQGLTLSEIFTQTPGKNDLLSACGFRGLDPAKASGNISDDIFFTERDARKCNQAFSCKKYMLKGYMCYQYSLNGLHENSSSRNFDVNGHFNLYMVAINESIMTREVMLSVSMPESYPIVSSVWSPTVSLTPRPHWYSITNRKFTQYTLPYWFSQDGFADIIYGRCYLDCADSLLSQQGYVYSGFHRDPSNLRLITYPDMKDVRVKDFYVSTREQCHQSCVARKNKNLWKHEYHYLATEVANVGNSSFLQVDGSYAFYLDPSNYPITIVIYRQALPLFQLLTTLGSILSAWLGVSMSILYSLKLSGASHSLEADKKLSVIEETLYEITDTLQLEQIFHSRKKIAYSYNKPGLF